MSRRTFYGLLFACGLVWRSVVSWRMVIPREDGVNYLWMAERFAAGAGCEALGEVFSPLLAMLIAVPVALGIPPFLGGQVVLAIVGVLAIVPIAAISERLFPGTERVAALLAFAAHRPVMLGAEIYTEPLFLLLASWSFWLGLRERYIWCGVLAGVAFWVRPEAALLGVVWLGAGRRTWHVVWPLLAGVVLLAVWRGVCGHGVDPVPKLAFIRAHNVAGEADAVGFVLRSLRHLLAIPGEFVSAFGLLTLFFAIGAWWARGVGRVWLLFGLAVAVICLYVPRWRFLVNWMFVVVPFAAAGVRRLPGTRWWIGAAVASGVLLSLRGGVAPDRVAEREVAHYLRGELRPGERLAGDMTRVHYFAGQRPLAPRHHTAAELIEQAQGARFVVLRARRATAQPVVAGLPEFREFALPARLRELAAARGMLVLARR